jgi:signal transduction histidine kinase
MTIPPATVRLRLTALYGGLFLGLGMILLAITYWLFAGQLQSRRPLSPLTRPNIGPPRRVEARETFQRVQDALAQQRAEALRELLVQSAVALAIVSLIAVALGWVVAGRVLRPLRDITATARRLSTHNLDERINLRGPRDELKELADTFDAMLARLAAAFEAQRRFVANASHELRTPLTVQRAAVDVALADPNPTVDSLRTMARRIRRGTQNHERLVASLLTLARSERGIERYEDADLADVVRGALAAAQPEIAERGLRVTSELRTAPVRGDPVLLERLAANLVDNAVRHNVDGGWLDVRTALGDGAALLRVVNSGPVIPPDTVGALFEPFRRRAPDRTGRGQGHGLGLSIVAAITAAHRGTCAANPRPDGGIEITVSLTNESIRPVAAYKPVVGPAEVASSPRRRRTKNALIERQRGESCRQQES